MSKPGAASRGREARGRGRTVVPKALERWTGRARTVHGYWLMTLDGARCTCKIIRSRFIYLVIEGVQADHEVNVMCPPRAFKKRGVAFLLLHVFKAGMCLPSSCVRPGAHLASSTTVSALARVPRAPSHGACYSPPLPIPVILFQPLPTVPLPRYGFRLAMGQPLGPPGRPLGPNSNL